MAKKQRETANDVVFLLDGETDVASIAMLQAFSDLGLRCFAEQCRHWQAMVEFELERRRSP
jgi:hypothetical protein